MWGLFHTFTFVILSANARWAQLVLHCSGYLTGGGRLLLKDPRDWPAKCVPYDPLLHWEKLHIDAHTSDQRSHKISWCFYKSLC